jgi:DnaJ-class molecular chaperone
MNVNTAIKILNIPPNEINIKNVKQHFREMALKTHPDKTSTNVKSETKHKFTEVKEAYDTLLKHIEKNGEIYSQDDDNNMNLDDIIKMVVIMKETFVSFLNKNMYDTYQLLPSIDQLFNKEVFFDKEHSLYIPLWHYEITFEDVKRRYIIKPNVADNIFIEGNNDIHVNLHIDNYKQRIGNNIVFNVGEKSFSIKLDENIIENKMVVLYNQGIPIINNKNIYDCSFLSNIIIHVSF